VNDFHLEDDFHDIIAKAQEGLKLRDKSLARQAGVTVEELTRLKSGELDRNALQRVAVALDLCPHALLQIAERRWRPFQRGELPGFARFQSPCGTGSTVNAYLAWDLDTLNGICFDTGTDASEMLSFAAERGIRIQMILITHSHSDHLADLRKVIGRTDARAFISKQELFTGAETFEPGRNFRAGNLIVESRATPGHSKGGVSYLIVGLPDKIAVIGDSLFAGSMGRAFKSYSALLQSNCERILTLPEETILCPGHGPLTTVGEEKMHNPFFVDRVAACRRAA
jgi:glyoxylase-like metal-dependent hydrolase (beta-lactamase superfamily II)